MKKNNFTFFSGDNVGFIQDGNDAVIRSAYDGYEDMPEKIYALYEKYKLVNYGVVSTQFDAVTNHLKHKKLLITYPHEWPPSMFKDAVLFHLDLLLQLQCFGITLKDALPENILFSGIRPMFVDFFSILPEDDLSKESWLINSCPPDVDLRLYALRLMFVPHMLIPVLCYAIGDFTTGRYLLAERFCNNTSGEIPSWVDLPQARGIRHLYYLLKDPNYSLLRSQIRAIQDACMKPDMPWSQRIAHLRSLVVGLNVAPPKSGYGTYYEDKKENWGLGDDSLWQEKQHGVRQILHDTQPKTVLDLGSNTGWFSQLACHLGASVVAVDVDISCADMLYRTAVFSRLQLTPLCLSFDGLLDEHFANSDSSHPFHIAALERLQVDCVLCLGLLHHLTLGMGKSFIDIFEQLTALTRNTLVLEFVSMEDKLIQEDSNFFPNLSHWSQETYNIEIVKSTGSRFFNNCSQLPSTPAKSRTLLIFKR